MAISGGIMMLRASTFLKRQAPKLNLQRLENPVANRVRIFLAQVPQVMKALSSALMMMLPATSRTRALPPLGHQDLLAEANTEACARTDTMCTASIARDSSQDSSQQYLSLRILLMYSWIDASSYLEQVSFLQLLGKHC